nr:hypothetical protein [Solirubrobacterales bacterium]
ATVDLLEPEPQREVKNALSQVQMLYAQQTGGAAPEESSPPAASGDAPGGGTPPPAEGAGPAQKEPSRLWTPGSG